MWLRKPPRRNKGIILEKQNLLFSHCMEYCGLFLGILYANNPVIRHNTVDRESLIYFQKFYVYDTQRIPGYECHYRSKCWNNFIFLSPFSFPFCDTFISLLFGLRNAAMNLSLVLRNKSTRNFSGCRWKNYTFALQHFICSHTWSYVSKRCTESSFIGKMFE